MKIQNNISLYCLDILFACFLFSYPLKWQNILGFVFIFLFFEIMKTRDFSKALGLLHFDRECWGWVSSKNYNSRFYTPQFSTVQFSRSVMSNSLRPHELQHARPPCPSPTPRDHSNSHPSSQWCHPPISSSVVPFSSCPQSLLASESFPVNQLFAWGGQSIGVSAFASFLPKNTQDWSPLEWTGWISLQSKGLSRVFSNTTVQKHQFTS